MWGDIATEAVVNSPPDAYKPPPYRAGTSRFSVQRSSKPSWAKDDALAFARSVVSEVVRLQLARTGLDRSGRRSPFLGVKRTCHLHRPKSEIDPSRTSDRLAS